MKWFGRKAPSGMLGVDVGASGIKLAEIGKVDGRPAILTYGYSVVADGDSFHPFDDPERAGLLLADIAKQAGVKTSQAMAALPIQEVFSAIVSVPRKRDKKELKPLIDGQISKLAPMPLSEMVTYTTLIDPLDKKRNATDAVRVLVTGASKTLVQKYVTLFNAAKLKLAAIDTEAFALIRSLIGKDKSAILILDIGFARTNIIIVERGIPFLTRTIQIGGETITQHLVEQMGISQTEAEQMKQDMAQLTEDQAQLPEILKPFVLPILNEINYAFELYDRAEFSEIDQVEKIILTGGSSHLPFLREHLETTLNLNVYRGNPLARVAYPKDLSGVFEEIGPKMAVAIGLAMRDME